MKLSFQLALGALIAIAIGSCWVDRKTSEFACTVDMDCLGYMPTRICDTDIGYCVPGENPDECPAICNGGCDMTARTCTINCGSNGCGIVECNGDSDCDVTCTGNNACGNIECGDGGECNVICTGTNACDNVDCNGARCDVTCTGGNACDNVDCDNACRCDVECMAGQSCGSRTCSADQCNAATGCVSTQTGCPATCN